MGKRFTWPRLFMALLVIVISLIVSRTFYLIGNYCETLDAYSGDVVRADQMAAREGLENLKYFYELNEKLKPFGLSWLADRYFFENAPYHAAAYDYLSNRYEKVIEELKNDQHLWARYLRANAQWRLAQGIVEQAFSKKDPATLVQEIVEADQMVQATKDDYAEVVKMTNGQWLPAKWNYDLTVDPAARRAGLMPKLPKPKVRLGEGGKKEKGSGKDKGQGPKGRGSQEGLGSPDEGNPKPGKKRPG